MLSFDRQKLMNINGKQIDCEEQQELATQMELFLELKFFFSLKLYFHSTNSSQKYFLNCPKSSFFFFFLSKFSSFNKFEQKPCRSNLQKRDSIIFLDYNK
jgi:hypothetical protein